MVTYYNKKDLVSLGNYLLSEERRNRTSELSQDSVTHADIENWLYNEQNKKKDRTSPNNKYVNENNIELFDTLKGHR